MWQNLLLSCRLAEDAYITGFPTVSMSMKRDNINRASVMGLSSECYCRNCMLANMARDIPVVGVEPTLLYGTDLGLRNHEELSLDHSWPVS